MDDWSESSQETYNSRLPFNSNPDRDINILLLGETGVGKTTFINALANYLTYNTLEAAMEGDMQILIPSCFSVADDETHTSTKITVGARDDNELCEDNGKSQTQGCKSYLFSIGDRFLRIIDTPGIGDCRGVQQDDKNFDHILAFVNRYEYLKAICILLKPNENRLNIFFKYGIKELLRHLNISAKDNVMFIFTNARMNFYMPGATSTQLRTLLGELEISTNTRVPFAKENTFIFDNEAFRYLAVHHAGHDFYQAHEQTFKESWNRSVSELTRLLSRTVKCDLHAVRDMLSLNEAHQLIRKMARPIGEIAALIEENIQLAKRHQHNISENVAGIEPNKIPQKTAEIIPLDHPRTICTSKKCSKAVKVNNETKIDYSVKCHRHCHLKGVEQEVINNPILKRCSAIDKTTGICKRCSCEWNMHMHVTYKFKKQLVYLEIDDRQASSSVHNIISSVDQRISDLKTEETIIRHICTKLVLFLKANSITPINEDIVEYINHFIREEKEKRNAGENNEDIILGLETLVKEYQREFSLINSYTVTEKDQQEVPTIEDIFTFKCQLFELPITGKYIQEQIEVLNNNQINMIPQREQYVELPRSAKYSKTMKELEKILK